MTFEADLTRFVKKTKGNVDTVVRKVGFDLTRQVIKRTPVDTGRARGNWQVSENLHSVVLSSKNKTGAKTLRAAKSVLNEIKAGGFFYIQNNVEYILDLEYGSSKQAPQGMMRIAVRLYSQFLRNAVRDLK